MATQRTIALAVRYQAQVEKLLDDYTMATGHLPACPAEALTGVIRQLGWGLKFPVLPSTMWAECDRLRKTIRVTRDLKNRIECPGQVRQIAHSSIAHELAHAVLHSELRVSRTLLKRWEFEAQVWAAMFLCPWRLLAARGEVQALRSNWLTMKERWARIHDLAEAFQVTASFMVSALVLHGVLERTPAGGIQGPPVLATFARAFRAAA